MIITESVEDVTQESQGLQSSPQPRLQTSSRCRLPALLIAYKLLRIYRDSRGTCQRCATYDTQILETLLGGNNLSEQQTQEAMEV